MKYPTFIRKTYADGAFLAGHIEASLQDVVATIVTTAVDAGFTSSTTEEFPHWSDGAPTVGTYLTSCARDSVSGEVPVYVLPPPKLSQFGDWQLGACSVAGTVTAMTPDAYTSVISASAGERKLYVAACGADGYVGAMLIFNGVVELFLCLTTMDRHPMNRDTDLRMYGTFIGEIFQTIAGGATPTGYRTLDCYSQIQAGTVGPDSILTGVVKGGYSFLYPTFSGGDPETYKPYQKLNNVIVFPPDYSPDNLPDGVVMSVDGLDFFKFGSVGMRCNKTFVVV